MADLILGAVILTVCLKLFFHESWDNIILMIGVFIILMFIL